MRPDVEEARTRRPTVPELEARMGEAIRVLDHGFVRVVDYMGGDDAIVQAARVSYGKGTRSTRDDRGLIRYLMRARHSTPFEMCELKLHVRLPIFVARQWIRHRTACLPAEVPVSFDLPGRLEQGGRGHYALTVGQLYERFQATTAVVRPDKQGNPHYRRDRVRAMQLRCVDEETGEVLSTSIVDVRRSGIKRVIGARLSDGSVLRATADHRCLTDDGWMQFGVALDAGVSFAVIAKRPAPGGGDQMLIRTWASVVDRWEEEPQDVYDIEVEGPWHNFVAGGVVVHNSVNEISARYSILDREFYLPAPEDLAAQATVNRQGRGEPLTAEESAHVLAVLRRESEASYATYEDLLNDTGDGTPVAPDRPQLARELARMALTLNHYTQWYWKVDLHNLFHFLSLRADPHAQLEMRRYAEAILDICRSWVPTATEAFEDYRLGARVLSRLDLDVVRRLLRGEAPDQAFADSDLTQREQRELRALLELP